MCENNNAFEKICIECGSVIKVNSGEYQVCPNCGTDVFKDNKDNPDENQELI